MGGALINDHVKRFQPGYFSLPFFREPLIIPDSSLPPRIKYGINSSGSPVISRPSGFLLSQE
ncbi:MAG: hypothetical protein FJ106_07630 [Deltaproteobacteria bacterium]|nr:hypothetical protein [Deltaproteobacteria bacterium]